MQFFRMEQWRKAISIIGGRIPDRTICLRSRTKPYIKGMRKDLKFKLIPLRILTVRGIPLSARTSRHCFIASLIFSMASCSVLP